MTKFDFSNHDQRKTMPWWLISIIVLLLGVGTTLAFFFASDYASSTVKMSGKVAIEAVGAGNTTIEDTYKSNLVINMDSYKKLIPGMELEMPANCKVYKSTTKPLLRAKLDIDMINMTNYEEYTEDLSIVQDMFGQMTDAIESNGWYLHTDSYFYYVGNYSQNPQGGVPYLLK